MKFVVWLVGLLIALILVVVIAGGPIAESWLKKNISSTLKETFKFYTIDFEKVDVSLLHATIELNMVSIVSKTDSGDYMKLEADLSSLKLTGINAIKVFLKKQIEIDEIIIADGRIKGILQNLKKENPAILFPRNINVGKLIFDKINVELTRDSSARKYEVREATLSIYDVHVLEKDTISLDFVKLFDFKAAELLSVSTDSMYIYKGSDVMYSKTDKTLSLAHLTIQPNFSNYDFTGTQ
jgi:hypothetical protein